MHKQPWKRKTCRKKDRIREQAKEKGRREDKKIKRRGELGEWTALAKPVGDKSCG